jgi:hypothetical protein
MHPMPDPIKIALCCIELITLCCKVRLYCPLHAPGQVAIVTEQSFEVDDGMLRIVEATQH